MASPHGSSRPANRLAKEESPYLKQHALNPVDWYPWGEEAFARARQENKPIFLSIGYSTCHWCAMHIAAPPPHLKLLPSNKVTSSRGIV